jgi:hypothetical protein
MEIVTNTGIEISAYAAPEPYEEFEEAVDQQINGPQGVLRGRLDDPEFLRSLADLIEAAAADERAGAFHLEVD